MPFKGWFWRELSHFEAKDGCSVDSQLKTPQLEVALLLFTLFSQDFLRGSTSGAAFPMSNVGSCLC